jgi:NADH-quinone oxidoreductase subunit M
MVLGAAYMLVMLRAVLFERPAAPDLRGVKDLHLPEYAMLVPLAVMVLWLGIYPVSFTHMFTAPVAAMVQAHTAALAQSHGTAVAMLTTVTK